MRFLCLIAVLMALSACTDRDRAPVVPQALDVGTPHTVYAGTTRAQDSDGSFGPRRSRTMQLLELTVSIPPTHRPGSLNFGYAQPDPKTQFTLAGQSAFASDREFQSRLRADLSGRPPGEKVVTVFVHGYNATQSESAFRAAQIAYDFGLPGALVIYSWPSLGRAAGYAYDNDSMLFARDGLEHLLRLVNGAGATEVLIVAHSMGGALTMEVLRQADLRQPGWAVGNLDAVVLISPDLDVEVFRSQLLALKTVPQPFIIMVSAADRVLSLSAFLRGNTTRERLGNIGNMDRVGDLPVEVIDTTAFSRGAGSAHFVAATSPAMIAILRNAGRTVRSFDRGGPVVGQLFPVVVEQAERAIEITLLRPAGGVR
jgi:esterase/lipase superfamily enzyme